MAVPLRGPVPVPAPVPKPPQLTLEGASLHPELGGGEDEIGTRWTGGFAYAPESHAAAEVRDPCDFTSIDLPALPAPSGAAAAGSNTGGTLAAGAHAYVVTASDANGQTTGSTEVSASTTGTTGSVTVTANPVEGDAKQLGITYNVYGRVHGSLGLLAQGLTTPSFVDDGSVSPGAAVPSSNTTGGPGSYSNLPIVTHYPYLIVVEDECSSFGFTERDFKGRAQRLLDNATPAAIEREFWTGALTQIAGTGNDYLANNATATDITPVGGPPSVQRGIQLIEDALAGSGFGGQGMIHVMAQSAPSLLNARRVTGSNGAQLLLTVLDNIVVPGVGYPGTGPGGSVPAAGTSWIYGTGLVATRRSEMKTFPDTLSEALDRGTDGSPNTIRFRAERFGAATFDGAAHFACRVTLLT